jgi:hypothetical protein
LLPLREDAPADEVELRRGALQGAGEVLPVGDNGDGVLSPARLALLEKLVVRFEVGGGGKFIASVCCRREGRRGGTRRKV